MEPFDWLCAGLCVGPPLLVAVPFIVIALRKAHRSRGRWGDRLRAHASGSEGPYRDGETHERVARRAPITVWLTTVLAPLWAMVTLAFCLVGALTALSTLTRSCKNLYDSPCASPGPGLHVLLGFAMLVIAAASPVLAFRLVRESCALPTAGLGELGANRATAIFCGLHYAAVLAWGVAYGFSHGAPETLPVFAIPCAFGVLVALVQWRASAHVARALAETAGG